MDDLDDLIWNSTGVKRPTQQKQASLNTLRATAPSLSTTTPFTSFGNNHVNHIHSTNPPKTRAASNAKTQKQNNFDSLEDILGNIESPPQKKQTLDEL